MHSARSLFVISSDFYLRSRKKSRNLIFEIFEKSAPGEIHSSHIRQWICHDLPFFTTY